MIMTYTKDELYRSFRDAVDQYFQLQRDYEMLKKHRDELLQENRDLKKKPVSVVRCKGYCQQGRLPCTCEKEMDDE